MGLHRVTYWYHCNRIVSCVMTTLWCINKCINTFLPLFISLIMQLPYRDTIGIFFGKHKPFFVYQIVDRIFFQCIVTSSIFLEKKVPWHHWCRGKIITVSWIKYICTFNLTYFSSNIYKVSLFPRYHNY